MSAGLHPLHPVPGMQPAAPESRVPRQVGASPWLVWLAAFLLGWMAVPVRAAVSESVAERLRKVIDIPTTEFQGRLGSSPIEEWHSDHDVPDAASVVAELKARLQGRPEDAVLLLRMARLQSVEGSPEMLATLQKAIETARAWVEREPGKVRPVLTLCEALHVNKRTDEAMVLLAPWVGEGSREADALALQAKFIIDGHARNWVRGPDAVGILGKPASEAAFTASEAGIRQAMGLLDRAVAARPDDVWPLLHRARARCFLAALEANRSPGDPAEKRRKLGVALMFPGAARADLQAALRLRPDDPRLLAGVVAHECSEHFSEAWENWGGGDGVAGLLRRLPEERQRLVQDAFARLERLGEHQDPRTAAMAIENGLLLRVLMGRNPTECGPEAARALRLDPRRAQCFDVLVISIVASKEPDFGRLETLFQERVAKYPQVRFRRALAKVQMRRGNVTQALETVREALRSHPEDAAMLLAEFALLLKTGGFEKAENQLAYLQKLNGRIQAVEDPEERQRLWYNFRVTVVVGIALEGDMDAARERFRRIQAETPEDPYVRAVDAVFREIPRE